MAKENDTENVVDFKQKYIQKLKEDYKVREAEEKTYEYFVKDVAEALDLAIEIGYNDYKLSGIDLAAILGNRLGNLIALFEHPAEAYLVIDHVIRKQGKLLPE